ncbi:nitrate ABC transporter substrate-binding protein [Caldalkalibacillus thermarum]|nr:nitrate ABC transporter substrate-binding protein [Caldalkalibacillus thermarum]
MVGLGLGLMLTLPGCLSPNLGTDEDFEPADVEKPDLTIGFVPITCATPVIMAEPLGFYRKYGLNVTIQKFGGFAEIRDALITGEIDAAHMLYPMAIAISLGLGSAQVPTRLAAIQNTNGNAIVLANKHLGRVRDVQDFKGLTIGIPFEYSIHHFLLRHYLTQGGLDPDRDVDLRLTRPPDMVANLASGNLDGYIVADPFNQRAVYEGYGFIYKLTKDIWPNHPCCGFGVTESFRTQYPKTYQALLRAVVDAIQYSRESAHREKIAEAIAPRQYLNQPEDVVKAVLTGTGPDGKGGMIDDPERINFDPYPWKSAGVWLLVQLERWGYLAAGQNYQEIVDQIFGTQDVARTMTELGFSAPDAEYKPETILGETFDAQDYL